MLRPVPTAAHSIRLKRQAITEIPMLWIAARNRETNAVEGIGFWQGEEVEAIAVQDLYTGVVSTRTFYNQALLEVGPVRYEAGLTVRPVPVRLSSLSPAAQLAFRGYETRGAKVQGWKRCYDPDTRKPVGIAPWFCGEVDEVTIDRPAPGGEGSIEAEIVSTARSLWIASAGRKSHEAQKRRTGTNAPGGDAIRKHKATAGTWDVAWGTEGRGG